MVIIKQNVTIFYGTNHGFAQSADYAAQSVALHFAHAILGLPTACAQSVNLCFA